MNKAAIRVGDLADMYEAFDGANKVIPMEGDDHEKVRKFKYAMARNAKTLAAHVKRATSTVQSIMKPEPEYLEYHRRREEAIKGFADRDEAGNPVVERGPQGENYRLSPESEAKASAALDVLNDEFAAALESRRNQERQAAMFMESVEPVELFMVPWDWMPSNISGSIMLFITPALDGVPEDVAEKVLDPEKE